MIENMETRHAIVETAVGAVTLAAAGPAVTGLYFPGHRYPPTAAALGARSAAADDPVLAEAAGQLVAYLAGERTQFDLALATGGEPFQERVWALLRAIPFGATTTYGALAEQLGDRRLARMVGRAVGRNPISIVVPCHRVVGHDGGLTGYAGGLERKRWLLELEGPAARLGWPSSTAPLTAATSEAATSTHQPVW